MAKQKQHTIEHGNEEGTQMRAPPSTFKKYNAVIQSAELVDIRLTSSKFDVKDEYYLLKRGGKNENKKVLKFEMGGTLVEFDYLDTEGLVFGHFEWSAFGNKGRRRLLSIKSRYLVIYTAAKDLEAPYVEAFLANVGRFASFPYFRSLVATYSAAASADLPILPVLRQPIETAPDEEKSES